MSRTTIRALQIGEPERALKKARTKRDKAMIVLFWRGGLRCAEACQVRVEDCQFDRDGTTKLHIANGKGGRKRDVIIGRVYTKHLKAQARNRKTGWLLDTKARKGPLKNTHISTRAVRAILQRLRVNAHAFRHTYAQELHAEQFSMREIQLALGHQNLETTAIYLEKLGIEDGMLQRLRERD